MQNSLYNHSPTVVHLGIWVFKWKLMSFFWVYFHRIDITFVFKALDTCCQLFSPQSVKVFVTQSCPTLCDPVDYSHLAPLSMEFSREACWSGLPFPSPLDLPDPLIGPRIEPGSLALQADSLLSEPPWRQGFFWLLLQQKGVKTSNRFSAFPPMLPEAGVNWSFKWGEGRGGSVGQASGWPKRSTHRWWPGRHCVQGSIMHKTLLLFLKA